MNNNLELLETAKIAAKNGGQIILEYFNKEIKFEEKPDKTFVSFVDRKAEEAIKKIILDKFPKHSINGEETSETKGTEYIWHVDPLDGTINFKNKIPYSCVSIGIENKGRFVIGVIYNPFTNELFSALEGKGSYLNDKKINVNSQNLSEGTLILDSSFKDERGIKKIRFQEEILENCSKFRMIGSNALQLTEIAKGNCVSSISDAIHSYDFIAGTVIVKEAGGVVSDQYGKEPSSNSKVIIASNNKDNHDKIIRITSILYKNYRGI